MNAEILIKQSDGCKISIKRNSLCSVRLSNVHPFFHVLFNKYRKAAKYGGAIYRFIHQLFFAYFQANKIDDVIRLVTSEYLELYPPEDKYRWSKLICWMVSLEH